MRTHSDSKGWGSSFILRPFVPSFSQPSENSLWCIRPYPFQGIWQNCWLQCHTSSRHPRKHELWTRDHCTQAFRVLQSQTWWCCKRMTSTKWIRAQTFCSQGQRTYETKTVGGLRGEHSKNERSGWHHLPWPAPASRSGATSPWALFSHLLHPLLLRWVLLFFFINHIYLYMCAHICTPQGACVCTQMCFHQRKDLLELALSFHHVIPATELRSSGLAAHWAISSARTAPLKDAFHTESESTWCNWVVRVTNIAKFTHLSVEPGYVDHTSLKLNILLPHSLKC